jgi:ribosomal protein S18 acetylase RimI-like enzyme
MSQPSDSRTKIPVEVVEWRHALTDATIDVLARAFARNPIHIAAFGADRAVQCNRVFFRLGLSLFRGRRLVAMRGADVVGFVHWVESPACQLSLLQRVGLVPGMVRGFGLSSTVRVGSWLSTWSQHDCRAPHWHFGPIGVEPAAQGRGVGRLLMEPFCAALDRAAAVGFLETDEPANVAYYQKFGFTVVKEVPSLGTTTFFMNRAARAAPKKA